MILGGMHNLVEVLEIIPVETFEIDVCADL